MSERIRAYEVCAEFVSARQPAAGVAGQRKRGLGVSLPGPRNKKAKVDVPGHGRLSGQGRCRTYFQTFVCALNSGHPRSKIEPPQVGVLLDRFIREEGLIEIKQRRPGEISEDREQLTTRRLSPI